MSTITPTSIISHWNHLVPGMQQSSDAFYNAVDQILRAQHLDDAKIERVNLSEGGIFSTKREYLQVRRKEHVFHVCAAPFGTGFLISWWLGEKESGIWAWLCGLRFIGPFFALLHLATRRATYYRVDTALMFQSVTHQAVLDALDSVIGAKGMRALSEGERKPIMRDFFGTIGGK